MSTKTKPVRAPRSSAVLWGWTFISTLLHAVLIGGLCGWSYLGHAREEAATKAKAAAEEANAAKAETEATARAAAEKPGAPDKAPSNQTSAPAPTSPSTASSATPAPNILPPPKEPTVPSPGTTSQPPSAENILGIDKTAKPGDTPKSPFAGGTDDLLKDLK